MPQCDLIIDSCCDLPAELVAQEGVHLLRFPYVLDGETFEDDLFQTTTAHDFYEGMRKGDAPTTAQLSIPTLTALFTEAAERGVPAVYLSFSSALSGSYDVAMVVRDQVLADYPGFELHVIDTHLASVAEGLLVAEAINQRNKGLTAAELAEWASEARFFINEEFMVEDLEALGGGGRIPASVAVAGAALDVKPLLNIAEDGSLSLVGVARGRKKGIKSLAACYERSVADDMPKYVAIGNADCPKDAERLKEALLKVDDDIMFIDGSIGPVIGSHVGPGMLAVVFWGKDKRESLSMVDRIAKRVKGE